MGLVLRIAFDDGGCIGADGERDVAQLRLHLGQRRVDVAVDFELERDRGLALLDLRGHVTHALGRDDLLFDLVDDLGFHHLGRRAAPGCVDGQDGKIDVGLLADSKPRKTDRTENDQSRAISIHAKTGRRIERSASDAIGELLRVEMG